MRHTISKKRKRRLLLLVNIVLLCALATATFAWFIFDDRATVESDGNMTIMAGSGLEIFYNESWGNHHDATINMVTYPDITGNGVNFYCPMVLDTHDLPLDDPSTFEHIHAENADKYYITLNLKFRTSEAVKVYLSSESKIIGPNIDTPVNQLPEGNKSLSGNHSRDGIAGAVRVAFVEDTGTTSPSVKIWIPNDRYELSKTESGTTEFSTNPVSDAENDRTIDEIREIFTTVDTAVNNVQTIQTVYPYGYQAVSEGRMKSFYWTDEDYCSGKVFVGNDLASAGMVNNATPILDFTDNVDGRVQEKSISVRIWIEGTDREADKALLGGAIKYVFKFVSVKKGANENESRLDSAISYDANTRTFKANDGKELTGLQYSFNGIDWIDYVAPIEQNIISTKDNIHIRFKETMGQHRSSVKTFSLVS